MWIQRLSVERKRCPKVEAVIGRYFHAIVAKGVQETG